MDAVRSWIFTLVGAGLLSGIALGLTPRGRVRDVLKFVCGAVMTLALISPVLSFDLSAYAGYMAGYREDAARLAGELDEENSRLNRLIIEEESAAYILDKAQVLGLEASSVTVTAKWGDEGFWYPNEAELSIRGDGEAAKTLRAEIEAQLGIPPERQHWSGENEG